MVTQVASILIQSVNIQNYELANREFEQLNTYSNSTPFNFELCPFIFAGILAFIFVLFWGLSRIREVKIPMSFDDITLA